MNKTYATILASCFYSLFFAQQNTIKLEGATIDFNSKLTNLPLQVSFDESKHLSENQFIDWMKKDLIQDGEVSFVSIKKNNDQLGLSHNRFQQYYKGYKIEGAIILAHSKSNEVKSFNGDWFKEIKLSNSISISEQQALQFALTKIGAKKYKWDNKVEEAHMQATLNNPNFSYKPTGELCIVPTIDIKTKKTTFQYAYKFNIYAEEPLYRANVFVDASSGKIIKEHNLICTIDAVGTASTKYSGTKSITTDSYTGGYRLRESGRGQGIETYNMNNTQTYGTTDFTNTVNTWTMTNTNQAATDAHFGAEATYDYYFQNFNRNSIDDNGFKLLSYVHYSTNYVNAFWDGQRMTYGDGQTSQGFNIMTALDVCGHEITHGVVENTAGLNGGEADALNEAFADIFGTSVEWFARPSQHDWLMGLDISTNGTAIRNMANPNSLQQPDTYQGTYWSATGEPHDNDGPCIYWFYLLSVGGSGTNDNSQAYNVSSITMAKAEAIAYRAMTVYMTPSTDYAAVRNYCIQAAKDLYGACSNEVIQTTNAWYAVGVGSQYAAGTIGTNFAASQISSCSLPATINFNNTTAAGQNYTWHFGDGATSSTVNPSHSYSVNGTYSVKLVATGCIAGSKDSLIKSSYITINAPTSPSSFDINVCSNTSGTLTAFANGVINWYDAPSGGNLLGSGNSFTTPTLTNSITYYAINSVSNTPIYGGPATNTVFGGGSNFNANFDRYLIFDVLQACKLKTVKVVANSAGNRTIELRNAAGTVLQSTVVNIPAGTQTVTLNFSLTPGTNYQLGTSTLPDMWRNNTGSGYPYNIGGLVNITSADAGSSFYYYFYNWEVQQEDCQSPATAITASVSVCTGLNEATAENSVQLFPNPTTDNLTFNLTQELASATKSIEIYDALGKIVKSISVISEQTHINVADLARGVYTCRLINTSNQTIVKRFIKE
ncbi:MAG: M4 family metallopeptidase [Bacteroidia bacterium]|nr:M4 family metallopeptidase [Bacteroidia bacterium]